MNILSFRHLVRFILRQDPEGMSAKVIPLSLNHRCRESFRAISIEPTQRGREGGSGDAQPCALGNDVTPILLSFMNCLVEEIIKQQILQLVVLYTVSEFGAVVGGTLVGFGDVAEEDGADDAASTPHECDARVIEFPAIVVCGGTHEHETLCIRDKFRCIQCLQSA